MDTNTISQGALDEMQTAADEISEAASLLQRVLADHETSPTSRTAELIRHYVTTIADNATTAEVYV